MNVSIRISSPGNDGPVTQANIAAALGVATGTSIVGAAVRASIAPVAGPPQLGAPAVTLPALPALPGVPSLPELAAPTGVALGIGDATGATTVPSEVSIFDLVELPFALPPLPGARRPDLGGLVRRLPRLAGPGGTPWFAPVMIPSDARDDGGAVLAGATSGRSSSKGAARSRDREKPAPRWRAPAPSQPLPASVSSGTSVAPASGGGSSGSGIPIFLALPFLAAMLDLARRVTLDRVALPSGHRSRMPENPG